MKKQKKLKIISECLKYMPTFDIEKFLLLINVATDDINFLDNINEFIHYLNQEGKISNLNFKELLLVLNKYYEKESDFAENRIIWIRELRKDENKLSLKEHQELLIELFNILNNTLNSNSIDYFHASGFLCYLLTNNPLERYHHDIDLYINIDDIQKIKKVFNSNLFKIVHTCEKNSDGIYRHGYKIENSLNSIPIWLSFYKKTHDGTIYIHEYFQDDNEKYFTMQNYNSAVCCDLSLSECEYNDIKFLSLSLEALYLSKMGNRKKDIYDCKKMNQFIDRKKLDLLKKEITNDWQKKEGIPPIMKSSFLNDSKEVKNDEFKLTKKRI